MYWDQYWLQVSNGKMTKQTTVQKSVSWVSVTFMEAIGT
jgi:hypothetical protein